MTDEQVEKVANKVIGLAINVHKELGSGLAEKIYQRALYLELKKSGLSFEREKKVAIKYGRVTVGYQVLDFVVEQTLLLEIKVINEITNVQIGQVASYLKWTKLNLGLILNFGKSKLEIRRVKA